MSWVERVAYLLSTDPGFRGAMAVAPRETLASRGFALSPAEMATVRKLQDLLSITSQHLGTLLAEVDYPTNWGGVEEMSPVR